MDKRDVKKLVFQAYNLSTEDQEPRSTEALDKWFENAYKLKGRNKFIAPRTIENIVFEYFNTSPHFVYRKSRKEPWMYYRQLIQYLMRMHSKLANEKIGKRTGGFDRSTIISSVKVIQNYYNTNLKKNEVDEIERMLEI